MIELQRQEMLQAMGLKILQPRFQLLGAKISATLDVVSSPVSSDLTPVDAQIEAVVQADSQAVQSQTAVQEKNTQAPSLVEQAEEIIQQQQTEATAKIRASLLDELVVDKSVSVKEEKTTITAAKKDTLRYRHRFIRVDELLFVINQPALEWQQAKEAKQFFSDIYYALNDRRPAYWSELQFDWPPSKQFPLAADKQVAQQTLHSFMQQQMTVNTCNSIVVWGKTVASNIFSDIPQLGELTFIDDSHVLLVDDYLNYWQQPESKRLLWQYLQALKSLPQKSSQKKHLNK